MTYTADDLADANLLQSIREHAAWQASHEVVEQDGILLLAGESDFPGAFKNCVARIDPAVPPAAVLDRAGNFFARHKRSYTVYVRASRDADLEQLVRERGYTFRAESPCMKIDRPVVVPALPQDIHIESFAEERHIRDATAINAEAYQALGLPAAETYALFSDPARVLARKIVGFVAYRNTQPLATALLIQSPGAAGVYWVGTAPAAERTGLGTLCTALATNAGFSNGAELVTLQASPFGEPVYHRLGYRTCDRLRWFRHLGGARPAT
jgi:ribosomal protein S18 acetylase RimI-like enzyme